MRGECDEEVSENEEKCVSEGGQRRASRRRGSWPTPAGTGIDASGGWPGPIGLTVGTVDEAAEVIRRPVRRVDGQELARVVPPRVCVLAQRHELHAGESRGAHVLHARHRGCEGALRSERAHVALVDDVLVKRPRDPVRGPEEKTDTDTDMGLGRGVDSGGALSRRFHPRPSRAFCRDCGAVAL